MKGANIQKTGSGMKLKKSFKAGWNSLNHSPTVVRGSRRKSGAKRVKFISTTTKRWPSTQKASAKLALQ
jgi:hypothetical protein